MYCQNTARERRHNNNNNNNKFSKEKQESRNGEMEKYAARRHIFSVPMN